MKKKNKEIGELTQTCEYLNDMVNENGNDIIDENGNAQMQLIVFDDVNKRYTSEFKQCVYELFSIPIPIHVLQYVIHVENLPWAYRTVGIYVHKRTKNLVHV